MNNKKKHKIALIGYRLGIGGAEKVMARLSIFFEKNGVEVHNIIVLDVVEYQFSGELLNLGKLKNESNGFLNKFKRLKALNAYLNQEKFDFIIDFRFRNKIIQELIIAKYIYRTKSIFTIHSYLIDYYMPSISWLTRFMYNSSYANVSITNQMQVLIEKKHQLQNLITIHNPIDLDEINLKSSQQIEIDYEYIIAVGQYETKIKQFDKLIHSYANSVLPSKEIHLIILGDGSKEYLEIAAQQSNVSDKVHLLGFKENPFSYLKNAKFLVLCSQNEGMPNVILESLACNTPVISFDCESGPREMIENHVNGILVSNQDFDQLTVAINYLTENTELYKYCKSNALQSIQKFSIETIGRQWLQLLNTSN
ncbi:glycosyltransferase [Flavobacterium sp. SUN052]|uniref:glycosyltransferase n=1 Tax=Flavobacterium sp. SUN052 TaxID=3002441 RepID=UPI00237D6A8E|nr:glycosyltransferase [Flavobacterium sp. SUN052]MEC4005411.1 glycosyltransferase [Flavobacterium sp. SUN052]